MDRPGWRPPLTALVVVGLVLLAATVLVTVTIGPADIAVSQVARSIAGHLGLGGADGVPRLVDAIVWDLRLPRVLTAAAVGQQVGRAARLDHHVALVVEIVGRRQRPLAEGQRQPVHRAVVVELGDVEGAVIQQVAINRRIIGSPGPGGDELVDVVVALIVAHVEDRTAAGDEVGRPGALVAHATERRALPRGRGGVIGVDLDDPAVLVRLVSEVRGRVRAGGGGVPLGEDGRARNRRNHRSIAGFRSRVTSEEGVERLVEAQPLAPPAPWLTP